MFSKGGAVLSTRWNPSALPTQTEEMLLTNVVEGQFAHMYEKREPLLCGSVKQENFLILPEAPILEKTKASRLQFALMHDTLVYQLLVFVTQVMIDAVFDRLFVTNDANFSKNIKMLRKKNAVAQCFLLLIVTNAMPVSPSTLYSCLSKDKKNWSQTLKSQRRISSSKHHTGLNKCSLIKHFLGETPAYWDNQVRSDAIQTFCENYGRQFSYSFGCSMRFSHICNTISRRAASAETGEGRGWTNARSRCSFVCNNMTSITYFVRSEERRELKNRCQPPLLECSNCSWRLSYPMTE